MTARPPWPPRRGDQARTAGLAGALALRHAVRVVSLVPEGFRAVTPPEGIPVQAVPARWAAMLASALLHPGRPLQVGLHPLGRLRRAIEAEAASFRPDVAVVVLSRLGGVLPALGTVPVVLDYVDALELNMRNRAARERLAAPLLRWEAARMGRWDRRLLRRVAAGAVVSERDRAAIAGSDEEARERLAVVPFGVAVPAAFPERAPAGEVVLLSGNLGYFPTVDGAGWFASEVFPRLREARPEAEWWLAGARPAPAVRSAAQAPGVRLLEAPPDLAAVRRRAAVAVAPMRSGSGTPIKVLEAMAEGVPVVARPEAAEGLDGCPPEAVAVCREPAAFASTVARLLADPAQGRAQAEAAWRWLRRTHALEASASALEAVLRGAVS